MANISSLLEIIRTAHLGRDMRAALHDSIDAVNDDVETCGQTLSVSSNKLQLKRGSTVLSEVTMPQSISNLDDLSDVTITSATTGQVLKWNGSAWVNGSGGDTVAVTQIKSSGERIATISVNGVLTDIYASAGGGGGGGAVDSVNGQTGDVVLDVDDINDVQISSLQSGQILKYNGSKWVNANESGGGSGQESIGHFVDERITEDGQTRTTESGDERVAELDVYSYVDSKTPKKLSDLQSDSTHRTVTDSEKSSWNNKADVLSTVTGSFTAGSTVTTHSITVKQYGNVVCVYGGVVVNTGGAVVSLGSISGVSLPSNMLGFMALRTSSALLGNYVFNVKADGSIQLQADTTNLIVADEQFMFNAVYIV